MHLACFSGAVLKFKPVSLTYDRTMERAARYNFITSVNAGVCSGRFNEYTTKLTGTWKCVPPPRFRYWKIPRPTPPIHSVIATHCNGRDRLYPGRVSRRRATYNATTGVAAIIIGRRRPLSRERGRERERERESGDWKWNEASSAQPCRFARPAAKHGSQRKSHASRKEATSREERTACRDTDRSIFTSVEAERERAHGGSGGDGSGGGGGSHALRVTFANASANALRRRANEPTPTSTSMSMSTSHRRAVRIDAIDTVRVAPRIVDTCESSRAD